MNFSPEKLLLVGIIALVVLGPDRLPHAARSLGKLLADFRRVSASLQNEVTSVIAEPRNALNEAVGEFGLGDLRTSIRGTITDAVLGAPSTGTRNDALGGAVGAPIVNPSVPLEVPAPPAGATNGQVVNGTTARPVDRSTPRAPDDPSFN